MKLNVALNRLALCATALLGACSTSPNSVTRLTELIQPYRVEVVQGNVVTQEQLSLLRPGLTRIQVREALGTPLITSLFHAQRWDYAFTIKRQGTDPLQRHVTVFFENDVLARFEADELPTEADFTARIDSRLKGGVKAPKLQASAEEIAPYLKQRSTEEVTTESAPVNMAYPPLEPQ
jgi:outer membrane protein assembly factor BamE